MSARPLVLAVALLAVTPAAARADRTLKFIEVSKGSTFFVNDVAPMSPNPHNPAGTPGDQFVISNPLASNAGRHLGTLRAICTVTNTVKQLFNAAVICTGAFSFKEGQISVVVTANSISRSTTTGAVVGGTGAYVGARGTFKSVSAKNNKDTITLLS
jgi:hypothetical protein